MKEIIIIICLMALLTLTACQPEVNTNYKIPSSVEQKTTSTSQDVTGVNCPSIRQKDESVYDYTYRMCIASGGPTNKCKEHTDIDSSIGEDELWYSIRMYRCSIDKYCDVDCPKDFKMDWTK